MKLKYRKLAQQQLNEHFGKDFRFIENVQYEILVPNYEEIQESK